MLFGVGLGPGDPKLMTLRAAEVLKAVDEVVVPGRLAESIVEHVTKPRVVEFPMGRSRRITIELAEELADRCVEEDVAFACLGDPMFYSTFQHVVEELMRRNPEVDVEVVPGVPSFTAVFSRIGRFVDFPMLVTTPKGGDIGCVVVLKASRPKEVCEKIGELRELYLAERIFMDGERIVKVVEPPERSDYLSIIVGMR